VRARFKATTNLIRNSPATRTRGRPRIANLLYRFTAGGLILEGWHRARRIHPSIPRRARIERIYFCPPYSSSGNKAFLVLYTGSARYRIFLPLRILLFCTKHPSRVRVCVRAPAFFIPLLLLGSAIPLPKQIPPIRAQSLRIRRKNSLSNQLLQHGDPSSIYLPHPIAECTRAPHTRTQHRYAARVCTVGEIRLAAYASTFDWRNEIQVSIGRPYLTARAPPLSFPFPQEGGLRIEMIASEIRCISRAHSGKERLNCCLAEATIIRSNTLFSSSSRTMASIFPLCYCFGFLITSER